MTDIDGRLNAIGWTLLDSGCIVGAHFGLFGGETFQAEIAKALPCGAFANLSPFVANPPIQATIEDPTFRQKRATPSQQQ